MDGIEDVLRKRSGWKSAESRNERPSKVVRVRRERVVFVLSVVLLGFFPKSSPCQQGIQSTGSTIDRSLIFTDVTIWSAQSVGSINVMSTYPGQEMFAAGIGLRRDIYAFRHTVMRWNFEIMPVCLPSFPSANGRTYHYGGGGSLGADLELRKRWRVHPFFDANVGLVGFTDPTPDGTRRKNYTLQFGPGLAIPMRGRSSLRTGIWFFHFSNMRTEPTNPGFDAIVLYMGYSFSFLRKREGPN